MRTPLDEANLTSNPSTRPLARGAHAANLRALDIGYRLPASCNKPGERAKFGTNGAGELSRVASPSSANRSVLRRITAKSYSAGKSLPRTIHQRALALSQCLECPGQERSLKRKAGDRSAVAHRRHLRLCSGTCKGKTAGASCANRIAGGLPTFHDRRPSCTNGAMTIL